MYGPNLNLKQYFEPRFFVSAGTRHCQTFHPLRHKSAIKGYFLNIEIYFSFRKSSRKMLKLSEIYPLVERHLCFSNPLKRIYQVSDLASLFKICF